MADPFVKTNSHGNLTTNTIYVVEDEVTFGAGGRWGQWASGGGSSLELLDPRANHRLAYNWGDSDETGKSSWTRRLNDPFRNPRLVHTRPCPSWINPRRSSPDNRHLPG